MFKIIFTSRTMWAFIALVMIISTLIGAGLGSPAVGAMVGAGIVLGSIGTCLLLGLLLWGLLMSFFKR